MRLLLTLTQKKDCQVIPLNYQYLLSSFIYRTIENADNSYSKWLHDKGFMKGKKSFKFFTFSNFYVPSFRISGDRMIITSPRVELTFTTFAPKTYEKIIIGMFMEQNLRLFDHHSDAEFTIKYAEAIPEPEFADKMTFRCISPILLARNCDYKGKRSELYMHPDDEHYTNTLLYNLQEKYLTLKINMDERIYDKSPDICMEVLTEPRSSLVAIKANSADEVKVRGYRFDFRIKADPELIELGYNTGFGRMNALGFGCVKEI